MSPHGSRLARIRAAMARRGLRGALSEGAHRVARKVRVRETHMWYRLPVVAAAALGGFEAPLQVVLATEDQLHLVEELKRSVLDAREWHAGGHDLWLVLDGAAVAFSCWIFRGRTPVEAHREQWLPLPEGTVCLEHSITAPTHRGQSIAPRAWTHIARVLAAEGQEAMITKVELENTPSRKAVVKAGFREMAVQRFERRGRRERVRVDVLEAPCGDALRAELTR